ncbi:molybdenum cofactor biosynthesis protein MoaE [Propionibacteriaceae bacterium Y1685]|uniref:molybdenum cofactor biosynthesis protein MoaE n=1 Tax=Microlunatus sp. Y1700 TaxID=3418487 RepID=UPI003B819F32
MASDDPRVRRAGISSDPLSVDAVLEAVRDPRVGGVAVFVGLVRNHDEGRPVTALDYTAHPSAAERLSACLAEVAVRHEVVAVAADHRIGALTVGDLAVVVAAGAAHRAEAFACCRDLIDQLKADVPIWKEQSFTDGAVDWVGL